MTHLVKMKIVETSQKREREKEIEINVTEKRIRMGFTSDFSSAVLGENNAKRQWANIFEVLRDKNFHPNIIPAKQSFK